VLLSRPEVFVSYSSKDKPKVLQIVSYLERCGVTVWIDRDRIYGGTNYGPEIVRGLKECKVLLLACSDASMASRNVKQEIQLAWKYEKPYLPVLLSETSFPEQVEYWLEGWQWIAVLDLHPKQWLPPLLESLRRAGVRVLRRPVAEPGQVTQEPIKMSMTNPIPVSNGLEGLRRVARFTDRIWPVAVNTSGSCPAEKVLRDLGAPQDEVQHAFPLGSRVRIAFESDRKGHLLLVNEGTSGRAYCLCPSAFAPSTEVSIGLSHLPQAGARLESFAVTGLPGREHLLAVISDEPLGLAWMSNDPRVPARVLSTSDISDLLGRIRSFPPGSWVALSTYFDIGV
jgi:hypothetical protein